MVLDFDVTPYLEWLPGATLYYLAVLGVLALMGLVFAFLVAAVRHGPLPAGDMIYRVVTAATLDLVRLSPRRVYALARLAVQEAVRRRVWVALVVFGAILLFAGWFLDPSSGAQKEANFDPGELYINFVLTTTTYLMMLLALFLSAFSLPTDIKNRTIYTVVTKPVRTGEIVLGRILGFTVIGTVLLALMGLGSYVFVNRTLYHTHELTADDLSDSKLGPGALAGGGKEGRTSVSHNHSHHVVLDKDGNGVTDMEQGHVHRVHAVNEGGKIRYEVGPPEEQLIARVPMYAIDWQIMDRTGKPGAGINIGKEWTYRTYLDGGAPMSAVWTFKDITPENFPDGLPLEMTLRVFRTYKGEIADEKKNNRVVGIVSSIELQNPETGVKSTPFLFHVKDQLIDRHLIPRKLERQSEDRFVAADLFKDLTSSKHEIQVVLKCLSPSQYVGVARADVFLKPSNASYALNFCKGYFGIWVQMVLVIGFGVMFSTFLSGPVAMLAILASLVAGFFTKDVKDLFTAVIEHNYKIVPGGGPIESMIRIVTQQNITLPLEPSLGVNMAQFFDKIFMTMMRAVVEILPNFNNFSNVQYVADGFNIPLDRILQQATTGFGFIAALFLAGHLFLRMREVAK